MNKQEYNKYINNFLFYLQQINFSDDNIFFFNDYFTLFYEECENENDILALISILDELKENIEQKGFLNYIDDKLFLNSFSLLKLLENHNKHIKTMERLGFKLKLGQIKSLKNQKQYK